MRVEREDETNEFTSFIKNGAAIVCDVRGSGAIIIYFIIGLYLRVHESETH